MSSPSKTRQLKMLQLQLYLQLAPTQKKHKQKLGKCQTHMTVLSVNLCTCHAHPNSNPGFNVRAQHHHLCRWYVLLPFQQKATPVLSDYKVSTMTDKVTTCIHQLYARSRNHMVDSCTMGRDSNGTFSGKGILIRSALPSTHL